MNRKIWHTLLVWAMLIGMLSPIAPGAVAPLPVRAEPGTVVLDGVRDASYVRIASDPAGDLNGPNGWEGTHWTDLTDLYVTADATNLYVYATLYAYTPTVSSGQIGLVLDVDGNPNSGGTSDPWGNAIAFAYNKVDNMAPPAKVLPDFVIRGNLANGREGGDNGWTEFRTWNGTDWEGSGDNWGGISSGTSMSGTHIAYGAGQGVEFSISLASINNPNPADVHLQLFTTQSGTSKGAYDTVPSDDQSSGWDDATTETKLVSVPLAVDAANDLASVMTGVASVGWMDMTRLHVWSDYNTLHLYIPNAYTQTVSGGQIGLAIDTHSGGGSSDPWGNGITYAYTATYQNLGAISVIAPESILPDYMIRGNVYSGGNGWTELRTWNGSDWNTGGGVNWGGLESGNGPIQSGAKVAWSEGDGLYLTIPFADIGDVKVGNAINLEFFGTQGGASKGVFDTLPSDDQATGWDTPTTQRFYATYVIPDVKKPAAKHDNVIWGSDLYHDSRDPMYRTPGGPVTTGTTVTLRLRAANNDLTAAKARIYDDRTNLVTTLKMTRVAEDASYEWWEVAVPASSLPTVYWYRFIAIDGTATRYYEDDSGRTGGVGMDYGTSGDINWQLTVYDPAFQTPNWVKNAIFYQIFPDRFRDGNASNLLTAGSFFYNEPGGTITRSLAVNWNTSICDPRAEGPCSGTYSKNFYGGDLQGIREKLDYLQTLGVTAIYLNPVFESPSNHKYDTANYMAIDDNFGDQSTFISLTQELHARGMHLVLDGVFNHTSSDSIYFDRYGRYPQVGACESLTSPYRGWYYFREVTPGTGTCAGEGGTKSATYESWFGYDSLPKLRANNTAARNLIWADGTNSVAPFWMQYADGWRLDVGGDVDPGTLNDVSNDYWEGFRNATHAVNPNTYIVGEEWGNASSWTLGGEWDATMNYQFGTAIMGFWRDEPFTDNDHNSGSSAGQINPLKPSELDERLHYLQERYAPEAFAAMMNLIDSHDTNRALFELDHNTDLISPTLYTNPNYDWSDAITRLKGVALLQLTMPGAPTIYYGDEVGLVGPVAYSGGKWEDDPYNRQPYPWLDASGTPFYTHLQSETTQSLLRNYYIKLTGLRNVHPALRTGSFDTLHVDDEQNVYIYGRKWISGPQSDVAIVLINRQTTAQTITVDLNGYVGVGAVFTEVLNSNAVYTATAGSITVPNVPAMNGAVLVMKSGAVEPLVAPTGVVATERTSEVQLDWVSVMGAAGYNVYRSLVSGGGYTRVATGTTDTSVIDTGLVNGSWYYYIVTAVDGNGLESAPSEEVVALPHYTIDYIWEAEIFSPAEITKTLGIVPTEPISGGIYILGGMVAPGTGVIGLTPNLIAQVGYGPAGSSPYTWTTWVDASYNGEYNPGMGAFDAFVATLLPEEPGEYNYVYRFSVTRGRDWIYGDMNTGYYYLYPESIPNPGLLHVTDTGDITPTVAPTNLQVIHWGPDHITTAWDPVAAEDLYAYEVYRYGMGETSAQAVRIARVITPTTIFTDTTVDAGRYYTYSVRALDTSFNASGLSNWATGQAVPRLVEIRYRVTVPAFTPSSATVFIAGDNSTTFGASWNPGAQPMIKISPTLWVYTGTAMEDTELQYKFTRGAWDTVEYWGDVTGLNNRHMMVSYGTTGVMTHEVTVYNWTDPVVAEAYPAADASVWDTARPISVTFSHQLDLTKINSSTLTLVDSRGQTYTGTFGFDEIIEAPYVTKTVMIFTPTVPLTTTRRYTVTLNRTGYVATASGSTMQENAVWSFGTAMPYAVLSISNQTAFAGGTPAPGTNVTFTVVVRNSGAGNATGVQIVDTLPATVNGSSLNVTRDITAGDAVTFTLPAVINSRFPIGTNWITNTATYTYEGEVQAASTGFTVTAAPSLGITNQATFPGGVPTLGNPVTYTVVVRNTGSADAAGVRVVDTRWGGLIALDTTGMVTAGEGITFTIVETLPSTLMPGTTWFTNTATYTYETEIRSAAVGFTMTANPVLTITKSVAIAGGTAIPGRAVTYTVVVRNTGTADAANVQIVDTLPVSVTGSSLNVTRNITAGDAVTFTLPGVLSAAFPVGSTWVTNTAVYTYGSESKSAQAGFQVENTVTPQLVITKMVSTGASVWTNSRVTYTIVVRNDGLGDAAGVRITDTLPMGMSGAGLDVTRTITAGAAVTFTLVATTPASFANGTTWITNTAWFAYNGQSGSAQAGFQVRNYQVVLPIVIKNSR